MTHQYQTKGYCTALPSAQKVWSKAVTSLLFVAAVLNCLDVPHQQLPAANLKHLTYIRHTLKKFLPADVTTWHESREQYAEFLKQLALHIPCHANELLG